MRQRRRRDDDEPNEPIEVWVEGADRLGAWQAPMPAADTSTDTSTDTSRSTATATARRWVPVGLLALGALLGSAVTLVVTGGDSGTTAVTAPTTSPATATNPTTNATTIAEGTAPVTEPVSVAPSLPFDRPSRAVVYLTPSSGAPTKLLAYEVDTGVMHEIDLGVDVGWYVRAVEAGPQVVVDGGQVVSVHDGAAVVVDDGGGRSGFSDAPAGRVAPGPAGTVWVRRFDPDEVEQVDVATGTTLGVPWALPRGSDLFGSMGDGRAVVRAGDGSVYVVEPDGSRTLLTAGAESPVEAGRFAEVRCNELQQCSLFAHVSSGQADELGPAVDDNGQRRAVRFQPDGTLVAVVDSTGVTIVDTATGVQQARIDGQLDVSGFATTGPQVYFLPSKVGIVVATVDGLTLYDLYGTVVGHIGQQGGGAPGPAILGVGSAHVWPTP